MKSKEKRLAGTLFESENIIVRSSLLGGKTCFVTFTSLNHVDETGFGENFLFKSGYSAIHLIAKWNHWYTVPEMDQVNKLVLAEIRRRRFRSVITYGASMGASGALLNSRALHAKKVIAIAPQYSIDPSKSPFEKRWAAEAAKINQDYQSLQSSISDTATKYYLYDPHTPDAGHVDLYLKTKNSVALPAPYCGHMPARVLQDARILQDFVISVAENKISRTEFLSGLRKNKRRSSHYWGAVAEYAARRRPAFALHAAEQSLKLQPEDLRTQILRGNLLARLGRFEESLAAAESAIALLPNHPAPWRIASIAAQRLKKWDTAVDAGRKAVQFRPKDADLHRVLVEALFLSGRYAEAAEQSRIAVSLAPNYGPGFVRAAEALEANGELEAAMEMAARAKAAPPLDRSMAARLAGLESRFQAKASR